MKQVKKTLVAAGFIVSLFAMACNKEVTFNVLGGSANEHVFPGLSVYALVHSAMHDAVNATRPKYEMYAFEGRDFSPNVEQMDCKSS